METDKPRSLRWLDIVVLSIIIEFRRTHNGSSPGSESLISLEGDGSDGLIYQWVKAHQPNRLYTGLLHFKNRRISGEAINSLRAAGLLTVIAPYIPTQASDDLFDAIGRDWRDWPLSIPIRDGELDFTCMEPIPELAS